MSCAGSAGIRHVDVGVGAVGDERIGMNRMGTKSEQFCRQTLGILGLNPHQIGIKAKTGEGAGPVGREEIIEARCVALIESVRSEK
jgi:2C-methyl-D-erythritol 2,4-cyclodiphosphate synthase